MKQHNILFSEKRFDVVEVEGKIGIKNKLMSVAILPYTVDEHGMVKEIGLLHEQNPFRVDGYCNTLITGTIEYEDDALLHTAKRELAEEGGITVPEEEGTRWLFLGPIYPYKDGDRIVPVFAVDVTDLVQKEADPQNAREAASKLLFHPVTEGISSDEGLVLSAFLRLFNFMYAKSMNHV